MIYQLNTLMQIGYVVESDVIFYSLLYGDSREYNW